MNNLPPPTWFFHGKASSIFDPNSDPKHDHNHQNQKTDLYGIFRKKLFITHLHKISCKKIKCDYLNSSSPTISAPYPSYGQSLPPLRLLPPNSQPYAWL